MKTKISITIVLSVLFCQVQFAATRYVSQSGTGSPPYTTWANASSSIYAAVSICEDDDIVLVATGCYMIGEVIAPIGSSMNRVIVTNNIILRSVEGPEKTMIDGGGTVRCVFMTKGTLDGFKLTNGYAYAGVGYYNGAGGGLWITNGCVVTNCIISDCLAYFIGGGMFFYGGLVVDSDFLNNGVTSSYYGSYGGGVSGGGDLLNCVISNNYSFDSGGGIYSFGIINVKDCVIVNNYSSRGGGCSGGNYYDSYIAENTSGDGGGVHGANLSNCIVKSNCATNNGGGMYWGEVRNCLILDNVATNDGGGCYNITTIYKCLIANNTAKRGGGTFGNARINLSVISNNAAETYGGAVYFENKYMSDYFCMTNTLICSSNTAEYGGGLALLGSGKIYNCTIADNFAKRQGGGVYCSTATYNDQIQFYNTIIYKNLALESEENWFTNGIANVIFSSCCTTPTNNLPQFNPCISDDPQFVVPDNDYHLQVSSPCIDTGEEMPWMSGATDLDGNPRVQGGGVDIGCYELVPEPILITPFIFLALFFKEKFMSSREDA